VPELDHIRSTSSTRHKNSWRLYLVHVVGSIWIRGFVFYLCYGTLGAAAAYWPIVPAPDDR
jgi:hypothetical protein